jgi:hypothetical protein
VLDIHVNIDNITADLKDGVITITAPKIHSGSQQVIKNPVADGNKINKETLRDEVLLDENESWIYE